MRRTGSTIVGLLLAGLLGGVLGAPKAVAAEPGPSAGPPGSSTSRVLPSYVTPDQGAAPVTKSPKAVPKIDTPKPISPLKPIGPGPDGSVNVDEGPSKALQTISPLPAVAPADGEVSVPGEPFTAKPPVTPSALDLPTRPGQDILDAATKDATTTLRAAGRLKDDGTPDLDANALQPQMPSAKFIDPAQHATLQQLIDALASGNFPPPLPVDPLALLQKLPDGIPRLTYRVCSESATKSASCSLTLPLAVPALADVTGDHTPDVLVDVVPVATLGDVVTAAKELLDVQQQITVAQDALNVILKLLQDPLQVILNPGLLLQRDVLTKLLGDLADTLKEKLKALTDLVDLGVAVLQVRLPTSEKTGQALHAHVWAVYDLPTHKRLSAGFDGFRRGDTLPLATLGLFTFSPGKLLQGVFDIHATLLQLGAGDAMAVTAGLATVAQDADGSAVDPVVASARFSPVPNAFTAHAVVDPGGGSDPEQVSADATSSRDSHLDVQVIGNHHSTSPTSDSFTQLTVDTLPHQVSAQLTRPQQGPDATVHYSASSAIDNVFFAEDEYSGAQLERATQVTAGSVPASFDAALTAQSGQTAGSDHITLDYSADAPLASLDADLYDRASAIVGRGSLRKLPTKVSFLMDRPTSHVQFTTDSALGSATLAVSRGLGAYAPLSGDHATLVTAGKGVGISAQVTGLKSLDAYYDGHPRVATRFDPGGQAFEAAANLDGDQKARATVSNLPATLSVDADTANHKIAYRASTVVHRVQVAYTKVDGGPTLAAAVNDLPASVDVSYQLGDTPRVTYQASSSVPRIELFGSLDHIETLKPASDHYLSVLLSDLPTKADLALDIPGRHLEGTTDQQLGAVAAVARFPVAGRDWTAEGDLTGVPTHFDADFAAGAFRFRGISGPLASAKFTVTNHPDPVEPTGLHVAAHYRESTGDLDASASVVKLTTIEYGHTDGDQTFTLQTDTGGDPVYVDGDVTLGADDTRLALTGRVTDLPTTLKVNFTDGKLTYSADKNIGLQLEAHVGKVAAIKQTGAPLFDNGVAAMASGCDGGAGCAKDDGPFCSVFAKCLGLTAIVDLPGLPTGITVDTRSRTVALTGYRPPGAPLQAYVRLSGLIDDLPDIRAQATLSGLPSPLDLTVGPVNFSGGTLDATYQASAPLGSLRVDGQATTTDAQYPELRGRVEVAKLPASLHVTGRFGQQTVVHVDDSAPVDSIGVTVTSPSTGYLSGTVNGVPSSADVTVDLAAQHVQADMSSPIDGVTLLAHVPYQGRTWSAYIGVRDIPGTFDADFAGGSFRFRGLSGPLGQAAVAVTNHPGAQAPTGDHLAVHYRQSTGDLDASARIDGLSSAQYAHTDHDFTVSANAASQTIALDADVVLAAKAGGHDDVRLGVLGRLGPIPSTFTVSSADGVITYSSDKALDLEAELRVGKVAALGGLGVHEFANGISVADKSCKPGTEGCANEGPFVNAKGGFAALGIVHVSGLPEKVVVDQAKSSFSFAGYQPKVDGLDLYAADSVFVPAPLTGGRVWATLKDLSSDAGFTFGPVTTGAATEVKYSSDAASAGNLTVRAEADGVPLFGTARALAVVDPIPGSMDVKAAIGKDSDIQVDDSVAVDRLSLTATGTFKGNPASGLVDFTGVPKTMEFKAGGFQSGSGEKAPTVNYASDASTLSGTFHVEAKLAQHFDESAVGLSDAYLHFGKLGKEFTARYDPESKIVSLASRPDTEQFQIGVSVFTSDIPNSPAPDGHLFDVADGLIYGTLEGHWGIRESAVSMLVSANGIADLQIAPGKKHSGLPLGISLPDWMGLFFQGFDGDYGSVDIQAYDVNLNPDVDMLFRIQKGIKPSVDLFDAPLKLTPSDHLLFHHYRMDVTTTTPFDLALGPVTVGCLKLNTKPGAVTPQADSIHIDPKDGPQIVSLIDPGGQVPEYILNLFAYATSPFDPIDYTTDWSFLSC